MIHMKTYEKERSPSKKCEGHGSAMMQKERMHAAFIIADDSRADAVSDVFTREGIPLHLILHGYGTADSALLNYLGFGEHKKCVALSVLPTRGAARLLTAAEQILKLRQPGHGIVFTVPVSGATAFLAGLSTKIPEHTEFDSDETKEREERMPQQYTHELIIAIVTKGCFPEVKEAANAAGARGGTLLHALGTGSAEAEKFLGIHIQPEKDVILIVVSREQKNDVMAAVADAAGIHTQGKGILFSLPVSGAIGLS